MNEGLSSREMNRAKRKARQAVHKQRSREPADEMSANDEPDKKRVKAEDVKAKDDYFAGEFPILKCNLKLIVCISCRWRYKRWRLAFRMVL